MKPLSRDLRYFFSGSVFLGFSNAYSLLVPIIIIPYIIEIVGLGNYGLSIIAFSATFFLSLITDYGYNITGVNSLSKSNSNREKGDIIIRICYTKAIICTALLILFAVLIFVIPYLKKHWLLYSLSLIIPISSIFNFNWAIQGLEMIKSLSLISIINKTIYLLGIFLFVKDEEDYIFINLIFGLSILISGISAFILIKRNLPLIFIKYTFYDFIKEMNASIHYFISNISIYVSTSLYPIILGIFVSSELIGVFAAIEKLFTAIRAPFSIYINLMLPRVSSVLNHSFSKGVNLVNNTYIFVVIFMLFTTGIALFFENEIVTYITNDYLNLSLHLLRIALLGIIIVLFNCPFYLLLLAMDEKRIIMKTFLIIPVIGILSCFVLSKYFGARGAFYAIVAVELLYAITLNILFYVRKNVFRKGE